MLPYWPQIEENLQQKRSQTLPKLNALNGHDKTVQDQAGRTCISRKKEACPLEGNCLSKVIDYQAKVTSDSKAETYLVLATTGLKTRFRNHQVSLNNEMHKNGKHVWQLHHQMEDPCQG